MKRIVLVRHGESVWNKENRFTGWTDVDLSPKGVEEAVEAGKLLKAEGFTFGKAYTSYLKRAVKTLNNILDQMDLDWIPVEKSWRLNEKHYGNLQGLNKAETAENPLPLGEDDERNPKYDPRYAEVADSDLPRTESLKDAIARAVPYWKEVIFPNLQTEDSLIVVAHGNSLRGIIKYLKNISDEDIISLNLPTAVPYVFEFAEDGSLVKDYFLGDQEAIAAKMNAVANQGKAQK